MKNIFYILLLLPTIIFAQYPSNSGQKITLGEQTTADGLVWRGRLNDTSNLLTNKLDTSVYIVLDTGTRAMWYYRASTTPKWTRLVDSLNNLQGQLSLTTKVTDVLPVTNGGTNRTTMPAGYILHGDGTSVDTAIGLFWDRTDKFLGLGTNSPAANLQINSATSIPTLALSQTFSNTSAQRGGVNFYNSNISTVAAIIAQAVTDNTGTDLEFYTRPVSGSLTKNMVILNNGNVGIGTASPTEKLHVAGNARITQVGTSGTTANNVPLFIDNTGVLSKTGTLPVANGGTGSATQNFVDLTTAQTVAGAKTFTSALSGTSATFKQNVLSNGSMFLGSAAGGTMQPYIASTSEATTSGFRVDVIKASNISEATGFSVGAHFLNTDFNATSGNLLNISNNQVVKFTVDYSGALTGTSATFTKTGGGNVLVYDESGRGAGFSAPGSTYGFIGKVGSITNHDFRVETGDVNLLTLGPKSGGNWLGFSTTGAATFSSSVTATTGIFTNYAGGGLNGASLDNTGQIVRTSSIVLKKDVTPIRYGLQEILNIQPVNYNWINEDRFGDNNENGFVAEDVMSIIPNTVGSDANGIFMDYTKLIPILTKAIQEQNALIKALEQRLLILENK